MENIKKFYDALSNDKAMQDRAVALNKPGEKLDEATAKATIIAFAKAEGYTFTEAELEAYAKQAKPMADESLDTAAGGTGGCACVGVGGGGGTDKDGDSLICACVVSGGGATEGEAEDGICVCALAGGGGAP